MDPYEATRIVYSRVQAMDPDNASKIMGFLLLDDQGERQIKVLAMGSDSLLQPAVARARMQLGLADTPPSPRPQLVAPSPIAVPFPSFAQQQRQHQQHPQQSSSFFGGVFPNDQFYPETFAFLNSCKIKAETSGGGWPLEPDVMIQAPINNCSETKQGSGNWVVSSSSSGTYGGAVPPPPLPQGDRVGLERLERELQELLSGRASPVSIAALPQVYYEMFGKPLQAEGYLTESQRHGKSGYNLSRLLTKLRATITLIDRPHGQHAVVLARDAHKFANFSGEHCDLSGVNPSSRQIYLTFPAESTFTEDDVSIHFRAYGPVQDVRIPYQQKRMFGFVTFVHPETVKVVLSEGNPHYICGARVLVKPYRDRGKYSGGGDRKHLDKSDFTKCPPDAAAKHSGHHRDVEQQRGVSIVSIPRKIL